MLGCGKYFPIRKYLLTKEAPKLSIPENALSEVERQKAVAAAKINLPWWYVALFALVWTVLLGGGGAARDHARLGIPELPYTLVASMALIVLLIEFRRRSGLHTLWGSTPYPALKRQLARTIGAMAGSALVELGLFLLNERWSGSPWTILVIAALSGCLVAGQLRRVNLEIRHDIREGQLGNA